MGDDYTDIQDAWLVDTLNRSAVHKAGACWLTVEKGKPVVYTRKGIAGHYSLEKTHDLDALPNSKRMIMKDAWAEYQQARMEMQGGEW